MPYVVYNYAPEGETVERDEGEFETLLEARDEAYARIGDSIFKMEQKRWDGFEPNEDWVSVEAYHENDKEGCGGVQISKTSK